MSDIRGRVISPNSQSLIGLFYPAAILSLAIVLGAYRNVIAGYDYSTGTAGGGSLLQTLIISGSLLFGLSLLLVKPLQALRVFSYALPVFIFPLLVMVSAAWSVDSAVTLSRGVIVLAVYFSCVGIVAFFGERRVFEIFFWSGCIMITLSTVTALIIPSIGVHQSSDAMQSVHAGRWRGVFSHRTGLGQFSGLFIVFLWSYRAAVSRYTFVLMISASLLCLIMAQSTGGFISCTFGLVAYVFIKAIIRYGIGAFVLGTVALVLISLLAPIVMSESNYAFLGLLGKDADLTGRTDLWDTLLLYVGDNSLLGMGYEAGFESIANADAFKKFYMTFPNAQSAYYDLYIAFGLVGLTLVLGSWALILILLIRRAFMSRFAEGGDKDQFNRLVFSIVLLIFLAQISIGESFYLESNNFVSGTIGLLLPAVLSGVILRIPSPDDRYAVEVLS